ncbi:MAG: hypothetical protein P4L69_11380 [Desulfosporosinus sp.]|nr:hypothetical protein [Desulfosporosinus sp.]
MKKTYRQKTRDAKKDPFAPKVLLPPPLIKPAICNCWNGEGLWTGPEEWPVELFKGIEQTSAMDGAKVCICALQNPPLQFHRMMHLFLKNGALCIDVPLVEDVPGSDTPVYVQHDYCTKCRKYEQKHLCPLKPISPIVWTRCSA